MGVNLRELVEPVKKEYKSLEAFSRKVIAIDAYNALYQFLAVIRQPDGTPLMDSQGRVTSHLSGLFYRTINLVESGIKPVYVFDGTPPEIKAKVIEARLQRKEEAAQKYKEALERGDLEEARIYAQQTSRLTSEMVDDAKHLLSAMGIPWVQAPSEGEAQAAYMTVKGDAWASGSQDYDSLLFGSERLVRNLTISGKRKLPRKNIYVEIKPELIELRTLLKHYSLSREMLIGIALFLGTDYNPKGVKGIGLKRALNLVKNTSSKEELMKLLRQYIVETDPEELVKVFLQPEVTPNYKIEWSEPDKEKVLKILVDQHDFSHERVVRALERLETAYRSKLRQTGLDQWFR